MKKYNHLNFLLPALCFISPAAVFASSLSGVPGDGQLNQSGVYQIVPRPIPGIPRSANNLDTEHYGPSTVQTQLRLDVDEKTNLVHFIRDNSDPFVITKAYRLARANPYAVRGYLLAAVNARQINSSPVQVTALKYNDNTALLLVSAEEYRFSDSASGDGIDTLVAKLDRKNLTYPHKSPAFIYFPRYNLAANLADMLRKVGSNELDREFAVSPERILVDGPLNAIVIAAPEWSFKHLKRMLQAYDKPMPEVRISYKILEIYLENDDRIGNDFQSWKNNDGVDLFSAGVRVRRNWSTFFTGGVSPTGNNKIEYFNFNPKWNTRYLDYLTSVGKAKLLTSGVLVAKNREMSRLQVKSGFFYDRTDVPFTGGDPEFYYTNPNPDVIPRQGLSKILPEEMLYDLLPSAYRSEYDWRVLNNLAGAAKYDTKVSENINAQMEIINSATATAAEKQAAYVKLQGYLQEAALTGVINYPYYNRNPLTGSTTDMDYMTLSDTYPGVIHGKIQIPMVQNGFLFDMAVYPVVTGKSATLDFGFGSVSLLGWNSDGSARSSRSKFNTKVQVGYEGKDFVVGGLKKSETVRSVTGFPILKDIPLLGLLFSSESESIKQSELVAVLNVSYSRPLNEKTDAATLESVGKIIQDVEKGVNSPVRNMFFQQYLIDTDEIK